MVTHPKALVVGGSVGGMSAALSLRKLGWHVDLIDIDPNWRVYGAGITLTGPTLRALRTLEVLDEVKQHGATWSGAYVFSQKGERLRELAFAPIDEDLPVTGAIMRPILHNILSTRTVAQGISVRLGVTVEALAQSPDGVTAVLTDGYRGHYDLVVGADGIYSKMRERLFPDAPKPKFTGQVIYRIIAERPPAFDRTHFYMGAHAKLGFNPVSATHMYMFLMLHQPEKPWVPAEEQPRRLYESLADWGGIVPAVRKTVLTTNSSTINYRPLEAILLPKPWYEGRVVLIGDAAHATTPHLASGAGMALEDGIVLADEISKTGDVDAALARFMDRRFERGKLVVENSLRLGELEMQQGSIEEHSRIMTQSMESLRHPA
jgi:2-polyprenyl-6-methoxyphenol hydroxylase-like FAD-dependent oxidoreductase